MSKEKLSSLLKSWSEVKEKIQDCLNDKNIEENKEKVIKFVDKAKSELNEVYKEDIKPLIKEGKKEINKIQKKIKNIIAEPAPKKNKAPKKKKK